MKNKGITLLALSLLASSFLFPAIGKKIHHNRSVVADEPLLTKAVLKTHTNDNDKDHNTGVFVTVMSNDGQSTIASANDKDDTSNDGGQYKDDSDHQFDLTLEAPGMMRKETCKGFNVKVWQKTHGGRGHDVWKFNASLVLYFADGTNITAKKEDVTLESKGENEAPSVEFSAPK